MSDQVLWEHDGAPTIEVRVFRHGDLTASVLVESEEEAALVVDQWAEQDGVRCEVDDLSVRHRAGDILEPDLLPAADEDHEHP